MNYTFLSDFCTIYRIPKIQEKLNTSYPNFDQKITYTWIKMAQDTVYPKPLAGPDKCLVLSLLNARRLRDKITDLQSLLLLDSFDIVAITET